MGACVVPSETRHERCCYEGISGHFRDIAVEHRRLPMGEMIGDVLK